MKTVDFFNAVLPQQGIFFLAFPGSNGWRHVQCANTADLAANVERAANHPKATIYFALGGYKPGGSRKQADVVALRSFWLDIDCGEDKPYLSKKEGLIALKSFMRDTGLPAPMVVDSGYGLHCYWPLDKDLDEPTWKITATALKLACQKQGLNADPSRTADSASVLRPVGSFNRKNGGAVPVVALNQVRSSDPGNVYSLLKTYLGVEDVVVPAKTNPTRALRATGPNASLISGLEPPTPPAELLASQCAVIREMRDTQGCIPEPVWHKAISNLVRTEESDQIVHEWSKGHPKYTEAETDKYIARAWSHGPASCQAFASLVPEVCKACPHFGKITNPLQVPIPVPPKPDPDPEAAEPIEGALEGDEVVEVPKLPYGWRFARHGGIEVKCVEKDKDDEGHPVEIETWKHVSDAKFWAEGRIRRPINSRVEGENVDSTYEVEFVRDNRSKYERFIVPSSVIGAGGSEVLKFLGGHEIVARSKMKDHLAQYCADWVAKIAAEAKASRTCNRFGWHGNSFVIGRDVYEPAGKSMRAIVEKPALAKVALVEPIGELDKWVEAVDRLYNHPGQGDYQFAILCGFAAPLFAMLRPLGGVTVYMHSVGTGKGKSSVGEVALSVWGHPKELALNENKTTYKALWAHMGAHHNLPLVYDELTNMEPQIASEIVYSISDGRARERLSSGGDLLDNNASWGTIVLAAGNTPLSEKLTSHRVNAEAEVARIFEYTVRAPAVLSYSEADEMLQQIADNYGHAGRLFIRYIVDNQDKVNETLRRVRKAFIAKSGATREDRFHIDLAAAVITSNHICRKLGLLQFDGNAVHNWLTDQFADNRGQRTTSATNELEIFARMLTELWSGVLVTVGEGDARNAPAYVEADPRGQMVGRVIRSNPKDKNSRAWFYLSHDAAKTWCGRNGISARELFDACVREGWALPEAERYSLGKGTAKYSSQSAKVRCWKLDPNRIEASQGNSLPGAKIIQSVINGVGNNNAITASGSP